MFCVKNLFFEGIRQVQSVLAGEGFVTLAIEDQGGHACDREWRN